MCVRFNWFSVSLILLLCLNLIFGQANNITPLPDDILDNDSKIEENQISYNELVHFGDLIEVDVLGSFEYDWRGNLNPEGFLDKVEFTDKSFYGLCRTVDEIAGEIEEAYAKFLRNPKVVVRILDRSKRPQVYIYGAVKLQQRFLVKRPVRLNELIILSGGLTDQASGDIRIFRSPTAGCSDFLDKNVGTKKVDGNGQERFVNARQDNGSSFINIKISDLLKGKYDSNPRILSGDVITILESKPIYVMGGVNIPQTISSRDEITLTRAIATAGGLTKDADQSEIRIIRREGFETKIIKIDFEKIKIGEKEDLLLKPYDVIDVPQRDKKNKKFTRVYRDFEDKQVESSKLPLAIID